MVDDLSRFPCVVKLGKKDAVEQVVRDVSIPLVRSQPGMLRLYTGPGAAGSDEFLMATVWSDLDALRGFVGTDWQKAVIPKEAADRFSATELQHYDLLESEAGHEPSLFRILLEVGDMRKAAEFYDALFGIAGRDVGGNRRYYNCNSVIIGLIDVAAGGNTPTPLPQDLYFAVDDIEGTHARANDLHCLYDGDVHGEPGGEIVTRPWGERSFYAADPYGNGFCFVDKTTLFTGSR